MEDKEVILTQEGYDHLDKELNFLKTEKRAEIAERIKVALGFGDLSENSEYDEAKNAQAQNEIKIADLENKLRYAKIINEDEIDTETVQVGNIVKVHDMEFDEDLEYTIVGTTEVDLSQNKISNRTLTQQGNQNSPYKITIKTVYERGFSDQKKNKNEERNLTEKTDDKNNQRKHYHILTAEERKKFSRGIRPSAAQREAEAYAKLSQEQKDNMIEIIDLTKNPANENNEIKLMPNKKTIINKKKVLNHDIRKKPPRGLRPSAADREAEEVKKNQEKYGQIKIEEIITNSDNRTNPTITITGSSQSNTTKIISNQNQNNQPDSQRTQSNSSLNKHSQDFKLLPNKKKIINPKYKNSSPTTEPSITIRNLPNNNNYNQKKKSY